MEGLWLTGMSSLRGDATNMDRLGAPTVPVSCWKEIHRKITSLVRCFDCTVIYHP